MFEITHNLAPSPFRECLDHPINGRVSRTRASTRGGWVLDFRETAFGESAFSYEARTLKTQEASQYSKVSFLYKAVLGVI